MVCKTKESSPRRRKTSKLWCSGHWLMQAALEFERRKQIGTTGKRENQWELVMSWLWVMIGGDKSEVYILNLCLDNVHSPSPFTTKIWYGSLLCSLPNILCLSSSRYIVRSHFLVSLRLSAAIWAIYAIELGHEVKYVTFRMSLSLLMWMLTELFLKLGL